MKQLVLLVAVLAIACGLTPKADPEKGHFSSLTVPIKAATKGFVSTDTFKFTDQSGKVWTAPAGTKTDCASIPQACMSLIGDPCADEFRPAALVHDAYCGQANAGQASYHQAAWPAVHRMFYEACLAGGTKEPKATIMYAAVYMFGPHDWDYKPKGSGHPRLKRLSPPELYMMRADAGPQEPSDSLKQEQFKELVGFIDAKQPSLDELDRKMQSATRQLSKQKTLVLPGHYQLH